MATLPKATTTIDDTGGAVADGLDYLAVIAAVPTSADITPRIYAKYDDILTKHGYSRGANYAALHFDEADKQIIFIGIPIATAGALGQFDGSGLTGTSAITVAAGTLGVLENYEAILTVTAGGTIGTDQIVFDLSLDGNRTKKSVRLGTGTSYTIPDLKQVISFAAGTLAVGDVFKWRSTEGLWNQAGLQAARTALVGFKQKQRSWIVVGDCQSAQNATDIVTEANTYETSNDRFVYARAHARPRRAQPKMSRLRVHMTGNPNVTFLEVGATGDTITRSAGSFVTDGFVANDYITITGSASNNLTNVKITNVTATVLTLDTGDLTNEGPVANVRIWGTKPLAFAEVGATGDTITRLAASGSWIDDGFKVGDKIIVTGTASNNITAVAGLTAVTATVLTLDTDDLAVEETGMYGVSITAVRETKTEWRSSITTVFNQDAQKRIDIAAGEAYKTSPITGWNLELPSSWAASIREYQRDVHIPTWRKADGPVLGWNLFDSENNLVHHDERVDGGLLSARFTCFRTWANGPDGAFIAQSLTRATDNSLLSMTHNMAVANLAQTVCQAETENAIGQGLVLNTDGTATKDSLQQIEERVNSGLDRELLADPQNEGVPRASFAKWVASTTDILNVVNATLNGVLTLLVNGTLVKINTKIKIATG